MHLFGALHLAALMTSNSAASTSIAYLGLLAGVIALSGFVTPAVDFGAISLLLLGVPWGILVTLQLLRKTEKTTVGVSR